MRGGLRLGQVAGIEIYADWSLMIIFMLISSMLAVGVFPAWHPEWSRGLSWLTALAAAVLFFGSVLLHELSHALVGRINGIRIPRITLFVFGGMAHMEGEAKTWRAELYMAAIGPVTSFVIGLSCLAGASLLAGPLDLDPEDPGALLATLTPLATLLVWLGPVNLLLAAFNLVPGFPLDGGRVLRALLWGITGNFRSATRWATRGGQAFAWLLMAMGLSMALGIRVPVFGSGLVGGLWLMFIGWFLHNAAVGSWQQLVVSQALARVPVSRLMQTQLTRVDPGLPVARLVREHLMASGQRVFPVERDRRLVGMVCLEDLKKAGEGEGVSVGDIMTPRAALACVGPEEDAGQALALLAGRGVNQLPVVAEDRLLGLLRREDMLKWLALREA